MPMINQVASGVLVFTIGFGYVLSVIALVSVRLEQPVLAGDLHWSAWSRPSSEASSEEAWLTLNPAYAEPDVNPASVIGFTDTDAQASREIMPADADLTGKSVALADFVETSALVSSFIYDDDFGAWASERSGLRLSSADNFDETLWRQTGV